MSMLDFKKIFYAIGLTITLVSCAKEKVYVYELADVAIAQPGIAKPNVKTNKQYISIAYTDVFGSTVSQSELSDLEQAYLSFADKTVIEDLIIRNFLNESSMNLPSESDMLADVSAFVTTAYNRVYNRQPSEYELWYHVNEINESSVVTPELFYYALLTSNEYRQY